MGQLKSVAVAATGSGDTQLVAGVATQRIRVMGWTLNNTSATAVSAKFTEDSTDLSGLNFLSNVMVPWTMPPILDDPGGNKYYLVTDEGKELNLNLSAAPTGGQVQGTVWYVQE